MKTNLWKASTAVLAGCLVFSVATGVANADPQPHMRDALATLRIAKDQLEKATTDKGGHRAKALALTKEAIDQVQAGIDFDNDHKGDKKAADDPTTSTTEVGAP